MNFTLNLTQLQWTVEVFKTVFDEDSDDILVYNSAFDIYNRLIILNQFANAFLAWKINLRKYWPNIWNAWFISSEKIVKLFYDNQASWFIHENKMKRADNLTKFYYKDPTTVSF